MAQSLVLSIDVCPGLGISPLHTNIGLSFYQADLGPRSAQELLFSGFLKSLKLFFRRFVLIASGTEIFWWVSLKFQLFLETSRFHCLRPKNENETKKRRGAKEKNKRNKYPEKYGEYDRNSKEKQRAK